MNPHSPHSSLLSVPVLALPLPRRTPRLASWITALAVACAVTVKAFTPSGQPLATGQTKFLGCAYSTAQAPFFENYFNQITAENGGKWGTVEYTRDGTMNWTEADAAYTYAKTRGFKYRHHILVWGSQQPSWISSLTTEQKREEIEEWFAAVANRYPDLDYVEVVNEPLHAPPNGETISFSTTKAANYSDALGGTGASGWEWILQSFRLARQYFPGKKLVLNEYGVLGDTSLTNQYLTIINLLKAENLIDVIAVQCHAFETNTDYGRSAATLSANLDRLAAAGLPIMITEMDIDGATDQIQLAEYQRVFPIFWNHPSVIGITLWGYRPGLWRNDQGANLVLADNTERPAMQWLRTFVGNFPPVVTAGQTFAVQTSAVNGAAVGTVLATDANAGATFQEWAITGGTGASYFAINATTGQVTVSDRAGLDLAGVGSYTLQVTVGDGIATSTAGTVTILTPASAPAATAQPAAATVAVGANASFTFGVSAPIAFTRQWQVSSDGGATWSDLANGGVYSSVASETLQLAGATIAMNGYRFRCVATNQAGSVVSSAVSLTVTPRATADFNQDGKVDLVWQNAATGERRVWLMNGASLESAVSLGQVPQEWQVMGTADFNGDGKTDILWQNSVSGERGIWLMDGTGIINYTSLGVLSLDWQIAGHGDFNDDGHIDIVWENILSGERAIWLMNGAAYQGGASLGTVDPAWHIAGVGDFDADEGPDLLWQNRETGEVSVWLMEGTHYRAGAQVGSAPTEWEVAGVADINGDQKADIVWGNTQSGAHGAWLMNGTSYAGWADLGTIPLEWRLANTEPRRSAVASPDFNHDGSADVLWQNATTGERKLWLMRGISKVAEVSWGTVPTEWRIAGTGDFNGDGEVDVVWQNSATGECRAWLMDGPGYVDGVSLGQAPVEWQVAGIGDLNGDGKADLVWQNTTTGERALWLMNGTTFASSMSLGQVPVAWQIVGTGDFNTDGKTDLVWQNTSTGERAVWFMDGTTYVGGAGLGSVGVEWKIAAAVDIDGDGQVDVLWQNATTGERAVWLMSGTSYRGGLQLGTEPPAWQIVN